MAAVDLSVTFPARGVIRLRSRSIFGDLGAPTFRRFLDRISRAEEITGVTIRGGPTPHADLRFCPRTSRVHQVVERIVALLRLPDHDAGPAPEVAASSPDREGVVRYFRHGDVLTRWEVTLDRPGRLRLRNRSLRRRPDLCRAVERDLTSVLGIDGYRTSSMAGTVRVDYDPERLAPRDVLEILDSAVDAAGPAGPLDEPDLHLPLCTASLPIAAAAQFAAPALLPVAATLFAFTTIPILRRSQRSLFRDRRLGADVLDSVVVLGCLGTMSIFPGAVLCWCLGLGRVLIGRARDNSRKVLLEPFGKQPRHARLWRDGEELRRPIDRLRAGDLVVIDAGEVVPVDGRVVAGMAMIDPHALTGDPSTAAMRVGDRVFASTLVLGGRVYVAVEAAGRASASARIGRILAEAAGHETSWRRRGERLADLAVAPTLALGALAMATMGPGGALAVLHRDLGSGIRLAAPLSLIGALALCAHKGIVVKDGRALELINEVDTVVFARHAPRDVVEGLRRRGIPQIAIVPAGHDAAESVDALHREGRKVCLVGDGLDDAVAMGKSDVSVSLRGASSIVDDAAHAVFLQDRPSLLLDWLDIARALGRNLGRTGPLILVPNVAFVAGAFTMGFGIMASVLTNNLAALVVLGHAALPLREVAQLEAERRHRRQISLAVAAAARCGEAFDPAAEGAEPGDPDVGRSELAIAGAAVYDGDA